MQKTNKSTKDHNKIDIKLLKTLEGSPKTDNISKLGTNSTASQTSFSIPKSGLNLKNKQNTFIKDKTLHPPIKSKHVKEKIKTEVKEKNASLFNFKSKSGETSSIENIPPGLAQNLLKQIEDVKQNETLKEINAIREKLETSVSQIKEDKKKTFPVWLQQSTSIKPYPYNFISAVRKKLEIETKKNIPERNSATNIDNNKNVKKNTEIETKKNVPERNSTTNVDNNKNGEKNTDVQTPKPDIPVNKIPLGIKSVDIPQLVPPQVSEHSKTFSSHKARKQLNYSKEPEEVIPNNSNKQLSAHSNKSHKIAIDSDDSDTVKNIPELPHEDAAKIVDNVILPEHPQNIDKNVLQQISLKFSKEIKMDTQTVSNISSVSNYATNSDRAIPKNITLERNFDVPDLKLSISNYKYEKQYHLPDDIDRILNQYSDRVKSNQTSTISATEYEEIAVNMPQKPKKEIMPNRKGSNLIHTDGVPTTSNQGNGITIESKIIKKIPLSILSKPTSASSSVPERSLLSTSNIKSDTNEIKTDSQLTFVSDNVIKTNSPEILNVNNIPKLVKPDLSLNRPKETLNAQVCQLLIQYFAICIYFYFRVTQITFI